MVRYLKRLKSSKFVRVKAFPMYGGIGVSTPSLHRESTDSLIPSLFTGLLFFSIVLALIPEIVLYKEYPDNVQSYLI